MLRTHEPQVEHEDEVVAQRVDVLRRKVAWQVSTAYGLPLEEVDVPEPEPEPAPEPRAPVLPLPAAMPAPEPEPVSPPPAAVRRVVPTLVELERRVAAAAPEHPELAEEWRWYLFYLRDFARADGTLDDDFGLLVETAFGPVLAAA